MRLCETFNMEIDDCIPWSPKKCCSDRNLKEKLIEKLTVIRLSSALCPAIDLANIKLI